MKESTDRWLAPLIEAVDEDTVREVMAQATMPAAEAATPVADNARIGRFPLVAPAPSTG